MTPRLPLLLLALAVLAPGCASPPPSPAAAAPGCRQLAAEITRTQETRRAALEKEQNAWKAVIPFAVAARYASGRSAAGKADKRLQELRAEYSRQGCGHHAG